MGRSARSRRQRSARTSWSSGRSATARLATGSLLIQVTVGDNPAPGWNYYISQTGSEFFQEGSTADDGTATIPGLIAGEEYCVTHDDYFDQGYINNEPPTACATILAGQTVLVSFTTALAPGDLDIAIYDAGNGTGGWPIYVESAVGSWNVETDFWGEAHLQEVPSGYEYCAYPGAPPPGFTGTAPDSGCAVVPPASNVWIEFGVEYPAAPPTEEPPPPTGTVAIAMDPPNVPDFAGNATFAGIYVQVENMGPGGEILELWTNDAGQVQVSGVPTGQWCVRTSSEDYYWMYIVNTNPYVYCANVPAGGIGTIYVIWNTPEG